MSIPGFALFCLLGFVVPVPLIAWLDRPRSRRPTRAVLPESR